MSEANESATKQGKTNMGNSSPMPDGTTGKNGANVGTSEPNVNPDVIPGMQTASGTHLVRTLLNFTTFSPALAQITLMFHFLACF
jgi:hypothetical protein